jgi:Helix-turn-helix
VDIKKQGDLEAAGWKVGDAAEFLELSDDERQIADFRLVVARGVRRQRESRGLSQQQLACRIGSSQSRVAKIEAAASDVSLDLMLRGFFSAGGRLVDLITTPPHGPAAGQTRRKRMRTGKSASSSGGLGPGIRRRPRRKLPVRLSNDPEENDVAPALRRSSQDHHVVPGPSPVARGACLLSHLVAFKASDFLDPALLRTRMPNGYHSARRKQ